MSVFYGFCAGMSEGAERVIISLANAGWAFGWYHLMAGIAAIPAGLPFGSIWQFHGAPIAFFFAGGLAAVVALLLRMWGLARQKIDGS